MPKNRETTGLHGVHHASLKTNKHRIIEHYDVLQFLTIAPLWGRASASCAYWIRGAMNKGKGPASAHRSIFSNSPPRKARLRYSDMAAAGASSLYLARTHNAASQAINIPRYRSTMATRLRQAEQLDCRSSPYGRRSACTSGTFDLLVR